MSHAFAPESLAHCAAKGHKYRHVRAWHAVGWQECYCCGETLPGLSDLVPVVIEEPSAAACHAEPQESVAPPSFQGLTLERPRYADATPAEPKKPRSKHPPRAPKGAFAIGERNTKADRNAAVLAMLAAGKSVTEVALHFGLTQPRIGQIVRAYAPPDFVRPPMGGIEKKRLRDERNAEIRRRDAAGEKPKDIATALGVCLSVVHKLLASQITQQGVAP